MLTKNLNPVLLLFCLFFTSACAETLSAVNTIGAVKDELTEDQDPESRPKPDKRDTVRKEISLRSPRGLTEACIIPKKWELGSYSLKDVEKENRLCSYDFYTNIGVCPKYNSTNPGILLINPTDKYSKQAIDASSCDVKKMGLPTDAKFKQSISCSYTPAILAYYQVSRILGDIGQVPVSVYRTMDISIHKQLTDKAVKHLAGGTTQIARTWLQFAQVHRSPSQHPQLVDRSQNFIYGALSDNVKGEEQYIEVSGRGTYETRYERFLSQPPYRRLLDPRPISQMLNSADFVKVAPTVVQMKDVSEMILLDFILNQQDRIGNIHYKYYWYYLDPQNPQNILRKKSKAALKKDILVVPDDETAEMAGKQAVLLKQMILRDNDCGVTKSNMMRKYGALERVRHFSPQTYQKFIEFAKQVQQPEGDSYMKNELFFTDMDIKKVKDNVARAKQILVSKCRSGELNFDLDLAIYTPGGRLPQVACE